MQLWLILVIVIVSAFNLVMQAQKAKMNQSHAL